MVIHRNYTFKDRWHNTSKQTAIPQTDLNIFHIEPAIIPLEATIPQTDQRVYTGIHFWDLLNPNQTYQVVENENINCSGVVIRLDHNYTEYQREDTTEDVVYIDLDNCLMINKTRHTIDIDQLLPPTDPNFYLLRLLEMD